MEKNIKILLVDDEVDFRSLMEFWFKSKGYTVLTASDGPEGIEMIKKDPPDIVFLDLRMPTMTGMDVLKNVRKFNKTLPVIIISAYVNDPDAKDITSYGISGVFYKGENFEATLPLLETAIRRHKMLRKDQPPDTESSP